MVISAYKPFFIFATRQSGLISILNLSVRLSVCPSVRLSVCLSVITNEHIEKIKEFPN